LEGLFVRAGLHPELTIATRIPRVTRWTAPALRLLANLPALPTRAPGVRISEYEEGGARVRVLSPKGSRAVGALLWIHGGGLIIGSPRQDEQRCAEFVRELGVIAICPYYRLAPKDRFPAAIDDCWAAWQWLQNHLGELGVDSDRVAIGGESAGGGLAASLAHRIHDEGGPQPAAQVLVYPMLDDRTAARRELDAINHILWNNTSSRLGWSSYLPCEPGSPDVPEYAVASRREKLGGLPPCWIGVGSLDLFLEEDRDYARRLNEAGVRCDFVETEAACHGFIAVAPKALISRDSIRSQMEFLRQHGVAHPEGAVEPESLMRPH
jgi:acetyl esterase/lipase